MAVVLTSFYPFVWIGIRVILANHLKTLFNHKKAQSIYRELKFLHPSCGSSKWLASHFKGGKKIRPNKVLLYDTLSSTFFLVDIFRIFIFALFFGAEWVPRNLLFIKDLVAIWNEYLVGYYVSEKWNRRAQV